MEKFKPLNKMSNNASSGGISTLGLLGVVFVVLKLLGYIDWSWWWVTLPFWCGMALVILFIIVIEVIDYYYYINK